MLQILINLSWLKTETLEKSLQIAEVGFFWAFLIPTFHVYTPFYLLAFLWVNLG